MPRYTLGIVLAAVVAIGLPDHAAEAATRHGKEGMSQDNQRYAEHPIYVFFENYILDVMGYLPTEKADRIQQMNLQRVFGTEASEWREVLREELHLSSTIDVAILDLWYRNREIGRSQGIEYEPAQFARDFTDNYMAEGSKVDVWPPGALDAAKDRIAKYRDQEAKSRKH